MRALTLRQPWAWAVFHAGKNIENRSWRPSSLPETIAIHAGLGLDDLENLPSGVRRPRRDQLLHGLILGVVDIVRVVEASRSRWFHGPLGWVIENPRILTTPVECTGALGLWTVPAGVQRRMRRKLRSPEETPC